MERAGQLTHGGASMGGFIWQHRPRGVLVLRSQQICQTPIAEVCISHLAQLLLHVPVANVLLPMHRNMASSTWLQAQWCHNACSFCMTCGGATSPQTLTFQKMSGVC